jgi:hypothetical protein
MVEYTDKELKEIQKRLMRAYNEICKLEKLLKGSDSDGREQKKIQDSRRDG